MLKGTAREAAAEFFGTFILIAFGVGVVAQTVLSKNANGSFLAINIGWGLAVMLGIYASARRLRRAPESGGHRRAGRASRVSRGARSLPYAIAQIAGAFAASALVFATYREALSRVRRRHAHGRGRDGDGGHLRDLSAAVPVDRRRVRRSGGRHDAADGRRARRDRSKERRRRRRGSPARWSACSWSRSASRLASTPATRSTRRAISGRACSRSWRAGDRACSPPAAAGGGCRSWRRSSAPSSARGSMTRSSTSITSRPRRGR